MKKILLIDDSDTYIWNLRKYLQRRGYSVKTASTLNEARAAIQEEMPLVVCCDLDLPDSSGMDFLDEVRAADKELPFILASCHDKDDYEQEAMRRGATLCMDKMKGLLLQDIDGEELSPEREDIALSHVDFSYGSKPILHDVSLTIPEKTTVAIVGPSGSGKTTLCNLMARFWDVQSGSVTLGGHDVREYSYDSLIKNFSFVFQRTYLFSDTIANNIRFGKPDASMEEVIEAAKKACCHDFISALPNGYDTIIGEGGATLSGGERQRISIARALLKNAPILLLDEATSALDTESEKYIQASLDKLREGRTSFVVAHRLSTIVDADMIVVMDQGAVVEAGTHFELLENDGPYARLYKIQFSHQKAGKPETQEV